MNIYWTLILVSFVFSGGFVIGALWSSAGRLDNEYRCNVCDAPKPPG